MKISSSNTSNSNVIQLCRKIIIQNVYLTLNLEIFVYSMAILTQNTSENIIYVHFNI